MRSITICFVALMSFVFSASARAEILFEIDTDAQRGSGIHSLTPRFRPFNPTLQYEDIHAGILLARVFENVIVRREDLGVTFVATPENDPGFAEVARYLTDGQRQQLAITASPTGVAGSSECSKLHRDHTCASGIDLQGNVIERITFTLKEWYVVSPGRDPLGDGIWHDEYSAYRLTIEGYPVPEPWGLMLAILGVVGIGLVRLRRN